MTTNRAPEDLLSTLRVGNRFLITSHINPDGDAVGSSIGLARILHRQGKGAVVWLRDAPPSLYRQLPGCDRLHLGEEPPAGFPEMFDGVIVLECPGPERTGLPTLLDELPVINIDHHLGNRQYGRVNWVESSAPAVGAMVYRLAQGLGIPVDAETATALYLTLVTDTGGFRFANATSEAFSTAAELVAEGASPERVSLWLYESQPVGVMRLLSEMLATLTLHDDGRIATTRLDPGMFERAGAEDGDSEGLIDYSRSIAGVEAVALLRRRAEGGQKVSLRSRGAVDVQSIARAYGGGGHQNAAGFSIDLAADELEGKVVAQLAEALDRAR